MRILIVEDDVRLAELLRDYLTKHGFDVALEHHGGSAVARVLRDLPDLVVLDWMLPGRNGVSICRKLRPQYTGRILMLTALREDDDQIAGLDAGADDYVSKPAHPKVLLARIRSLLRHHTENPSAHKEAAPDIAPNQSDISQPATLLQYGPLRIDSQTRLATVGTATLELTGAEFDLLWLLACNVGKILSRDFLMSALRGVSYDGLDRTMDIRICRIRNKLDAFDPPPAAIRTIRGRGYLFSPNT
jgi:two-component system, OmpR family, response regulator RstA